MQNRKNIQTCDNNDGGIMLKLEQTEQNKKEGHILVHFLGDDFKGAKKKTGIARLIGIANELSVQFLVTFQSNTTGFLVFIVEQFFISSIELADGLVGHSVHTVNSEFSKSDGTITVNINGSELISRNLSILVEVSQIGNLVPQVSHDLLVFLECGFNDGVANGQAFEIVLIQETIVVDVIHVPDDE